MPQSKAIKELVRITGESHALTDASALEEYSVDGIVPKAVLFPGSEEEISEIMKIASRESVSVMPVGSRTKRGLGNIPSKLDILLSTQRLNRVLGHEAADLVATSECGVTLSGFQKVLKDNNQFLPVDSMQTAGATLGGALASNSSGPMRLRYGTLRELLIGIKVVRADGSVFKGGSKVVKNVAGYDLPKLYVGSLGTLGIITEATLRLYPIPERSETYLVSFTTLEKCAETVMELLKSELVMTSLELLNPTLVKEVTERAGITLKRKKYALAIRVMNVDKAVGDQMSLVKKVSNKRRGEGVSVEGTLEQKLWEEIVNFPGNFPAQNHLRLKAGVLITQVPEIFRALEKLNKENGIKAYASARAGNGVLDASLVGEGSLVPAVKTLRELTAKMGGSLVIEDAPVALKSEVGVWGDMGSALGLMKRIKSNFDPGGILNPGRFI